MVIINSFEEYKAYLGLQIGESGWHKIDQKQVNDSNQAIHAGISGGSEEKLIDEAKSQVADSYLTISLIPYLWKQIADIREVKMEVNYGIENFRFNQKVSAGGNVRLRAKLISISDLRGITKVVIQADLDIEGYTETAYTGNVIFLYHFK